MLFETVGYGELLANVVLLQFQCDDNGLGVDYVF